MAQQENPTHASPENENAVQVQPLSPKAVEALVAGIAFYPDAVVEQVLDASQYPDAIAEAVAGTAAEEQQQAWPASVQSLGTSPEVLRQLKDNATITARLALAARTQLAAVWSAIDRVRTQFESAQADTATETVATGATASSGVLYPTGIRGRLLDDPGDRRDRCVVHSDGADCLWAGDRRRDRTQWQLGSHHRKWWSGCRHRRRHNLCRCCRARDRGHVQWHGRLRAGAGHRQRHAKRQWRLLSIPRVRVGVQQYRAVGQG